MQSEIVLYESSPNTPTIPASTQEGLALSTSNSNSIPIATIEHELTFVDKRVQINSQPSLLETVSSDTNGDFNQLSTSDNNVIVFHLPKNEPSFGISYLSFLFIVFIEKYIYTYIHREIERGTSVCNDDILDWLVVD